MTCFICNEPATEIDVGDDYEERVCPGCGHYRITESALLLMKTHGWSFDVELARTWIAQKKRYGFVPTIDSYQASCLTGA